MNSNLVVFEMGFFQNQVDALDPQIWANESLMILFQNLVAAQLVHRNFENEIAKFGDVVNTRKPGAFVAEHKTDADSVTTQDAILNNIAIPLNIWSHVSYVIHDGEESRSMKSLIDEFLMPASIAMAKDVDQAVLGVWPQFMPNAVGQLGQISSTTAVQYILNARGEMNTNLAPVAPRNIIWGSVSETAVLQTNLFLKAQERGDGGYALENAVLGHVLGFQHVMDQNMSYINPSLADTHYSASACKVTNALAAGGTGSQACTMTGYQLVPGQWVTIAGDYLPQEISAVTYSSPSTTAFTLVGPLGYAISALAPITVYNTCLNSGAQAIGYNKWITLTGFTANLPPQVGQLIAFGTTVGGTREVHVVTAYSYISSTSCMVMLEAPLVTALTDGATIFLGPAGGYNLALHPNAVALVSRPLALPRQGVGALSAVASNGGIGIRVVITYDGSAQGHRVTLDLLYGVQVLDVNLGAVIYG